MGKFLYVDENERCGQMKAGPWHHLYNLFFEKKTRGLSFLEASLSLPAQTNQRPRAHDEVRYRGRARTMARIQEDWCGLRGPAIPQKTMEQGLVNSRGSGVCVYRVSRRSHGWVTLCFSQRRTNS